MVKPVCNRCKFELLEHSYLIKKENNGEMNTYPETF